MRMATTLPGLLSLAINVVIYMIIIDVIISYCIAAGMKISPYNPFIRGLRSVVTPIVTPIRRILPSPSKMGGWDFSPMVAILLLEFLQNIIVGYAR